MKKCSIQKRLISLLTLVLLLLPIMSLAVYASSEIVDFAFTYNGSAAVYTVSAVKSDLGESTAGSAGVGVHLAEFGAGNVTIWVNNKDGLTVTGTRTVTGKGNYTLYYTMSKLPPSGSTTVTLYGKSMQSVQMMAGYFQP